MKYQTFRHFLLLASGLILGWISTPSQAGQPGQAGFQTFNFTYQSKAGAKRERKIFLWYPTDQEEKNHIYDATQPGSVALKAPIKDGAHPLVIFSHGFWGRADQSVFLMEAWARAGYIVASTHHADAMTNARKKPVLPPNFLSMKGWKDDKFFDRKEDVSAMIDELLRLNQKEGSALEGHIHPEQIGVSGHSMGGYTSFGLAGARKAWHDNRIKAALLLSPYLHPYYNSGDPAEIDIPVMMQGGTLDIVVTPFLKKLYKQMECDRYYLVLNRVEHYGWTDFILIGGKNTTDIIKDGNPKLMVHYSLTFFDQHLRGIDRKKDLVKKADLTDWLANPAQ